MGKAKRNKNKARKDNPTGLLSVKELELQEEELNNENVPSVIANVVEQLQSVNAESRECACLTVSSLAVQPNAVPLLLQNHIVKIMGPLMLDRSAGVRQAAVGALRNVTVDGGSQACDAMTADDIMTPLAALLKQYGPNWDPSQADNKKTDKSASSLEMSIFIQAVHLLWNMCESSPVALSVFNREDLVHILLPCLHAQTHGHALAVAAAQCLHTVAEENAEVLRVLSEDSTVQLLQSIVQGQHGNMEQLHLKTLATGLLYYISCGELASECGAMVSSVIALLADTLDLDAHAMLYELTEQWIKIEKQELTGSALAKSSAAKSVAAAAGAEAGEEEEKMEENTAAEGGEEEEEEGQKEQEKTTAIERVDKRHDKFDLVKVGEWEHLLNAQRLSLEILTNLCSGADDEAEELEEYEASDNEDEAMEAEIEGATGSSLCVPSEIHRAFVSHELLTKITAKVAFPDISRCQSFKSYPRSKTLFKRLTTLQSHALLCLHNLVAALPLEAFQGTDDQLHPLWLNLSQLALSQEAGENVELQEAGTSAMRAVIEKLAELKSPKFKDTTEADVQFLFALGRGSQNAQVRANTVRIISTIGCILAENPQPHHLLKGIGVFLLEVACKDGELWVVAESLDALFDVFAEDHVDVVAKEIELLQKLRLLVPVLKTKIQQKKKSLREHLPIVMTAKTNLSRFIQYKAQSR